MTQTHRVTHSEVFIRLLQGDKVARDADGVARELLQRQQHAESALLALFDEFDDFDALVRECVPTLESLAATEAPRRERNSARRGARSRTVARGRAAVNAAHAQSATGQSRR